MALALSYDGAVEALRAAAPRGMKLGLERIEALLRAMGDPQRGLRGVLVAGTNGKGSVCATVDAICRAAGLRTVLLTKPHLVSWCERFIVDGALLSEERFAQLLDTVLDAEASRHDDAGAATQFELLTAMGVQLAHQEQPDVIICEVGLGGRLDSTNVLDLGVAAVTSIGLDHTAQLGTTIAAIAAEKAGIIKPGNDVVTSADGEALQVITDAATARGARLHAAHPLPGASLHGDFQAQNTGCALGVISVLREAHPQIDDAAITAGLASVRWPGRLQLVEGRPALLLDAGHNPDAIAALVRNLDELAGGRRRALLIGAMRDKDLRAMLAALTDVRAEGVVFSRSGSPRAASSAELLELWGQLTVAPARATDDSTDALAMAEVIAGRDGVVVVCGSLALVGDVMAARGLRPFAVS